MSSVVTKSSPENPAPSSSRATRATVSPDDSSSFISSPGNTHWFANGGSVALRRVSSTAPSRSTMSQTRTCSAISLSCQRLPHDDHLGLEAGALPEVHTELVRGISTETYLVDARALAPRLGFRKELAAYA